MTVDDWLLITAGAALLGVGMCTVSVFATGSKLTAAIMRRIRRRPPGRHRH